MLIPAIFESSRPLFIDRVFHDFFENGISQFENFDTDLIDRGDSFQLQAELPGFNKDEISIEMNQDTLKISANHKEEMKENKDNYIRQERRYRSYSRSFYIPGIDKETITATYQNGLLDITLPKVEQLMNESKRIEVK